MSPVCFLVAHCRAQGLSLCQPHQQAPPTLADPPFCTIAITGTFLVPFSVLNFAVAANLGRFRQSTGTYLGLDTDSAKNKNFDQKDKPLSPKSPAAAFSPMFVASRIQGNFVENVPIALIFAAVAELNGADPQILKWLLATMMVARVSHFVGLTNNLLLFRAFGFWATTIVQLSCAGMACRKGLKDWV